MVRILDVRLASLRSSSTRSLLEETNAISIPEKKAESNSMMMISIMVSVMADWVWWERHA